MRRVVTIDQRKRALAVFLFPTVALATGLTLFYSVHGQLPRFARAPSALLLAPIAIVDGLCYAARSGNLRQGAPDLYRQLHIRCCLMRTLAFRAESTAMPDVTKRCS